MKISKKLLKKLIKEEREKILNEMLPPKQGDRYDPITQEILEDTIEYVDRAVSGSASFEDAITSDILRAAADYADGFVR